MRLSQTASKYSLSSFTSVCIDRDAVVVSDASLTSGNRRGQYEHNNLEKTTDYSMVKLVNIAFTVLFL